MKNFYFLIITLLSINITMAQTTYSPVYDGTFDGTIYTQTFNFPTGAAGYAAFANNNANIYPLAFSNGGKITFKATVAADAEVYFRFEANPYPNVTPDYNTVNVQLLASNPDNTSYEVTIPANATNTYNSALMYVVTRDVDVSLLEIKILTYDTDGTTVLKTDWPVYDGVFDGTVYTQTFTFPTGAAGYAAFANNNASIYPLAFSNGGKITFKATVAADAEVYFRFEANPYPNVTPDYNTVNVQLLASNPDNTPYEVTIPANATNTYNSALLYVVTRDVDVTLSEIVITSNAPLSTKNFEIAGLNVYPNPAQDSWTVKTQNIKMSTIQVFDILGKQVLSLAPNAIEAKIDASALKSGLYFAKINTDNGSSSVKLVRQ